MYYYLNKYLASVRTEYKNGSQLLCGSINKEYKKIQNDNP